MKKLFSIPILFLLAICGHGHLLAQTANSLEALELEQFTLPNGRYGNHVQSIVQDDYGFMWFGSQNGLHRWDGHRFKTYMPDRWDNASISSHYVEFVYVAKDGSLWIGTWGEGLNHFKHETDKFKRYRHDDKDPNTLSSNHISVITEDNNGNLWIGTQDGLDRLNLKTGKIKRFKHDKSDPRSLDCNQVRALYVDRSGTLWVGTGFPYFDNKQGGLLKYDPTTESFTRYLHQPNEPSSLLSPYVRAIQEDSKGRLWVGSSKGLQIFDRISGTFSSPSVDLDFKENQKKGWSHLTFFMEDNQGRLWTGDFGAGLICADPKTDELALFNNRLLTPAKRRLVENAAWTMCQSDDGVLWLSTADTKARVYRIRQPKMVAADIEPLPNPGVSVQPSADKAAERISDLAIYNDQKGGTKETGAPTSFDGPAKEQVAVPPLEIRSTGLVWSVDGQEPTVLMKKDTRSGSVEIYRLEPAAIQATWVSDPFEDLNENHWVCLENGLLKLDRRKRQGIFYEAKKIGGTPPFKGMVMDGRGALWILGQSLLKFEPEKERAFSFEKVAGETKLPETADNITANENGDIVLMTEDGLHAFNPGAWADSTYAPKLRITDFTLLDLEDQAEFDSLQQADFWENNLLELEHFQNAFFISFSVLDFQSPELHQLEYKLENHDKNWRQAEGDPKAIYANVPPGEYTFKVRGANQFGIWGHETELGLLIKAPWWKTWWAYLAYSLLALLLIFLVYRYELNKRLAQSEAVRLQELHDTKSRLYTNITHEFRTPLTIIMGMAQQIRENPKAHLDNGLGLIHKNGQQLLGLVNQLLDLSKVEDGKMTLKPTEGDVVGFLKKQVEGMENYATDKGIGLHFIPEMGNLDMAFDKEKLQQVMANVLSNAIKFTPSGGHVYINLAANDNDPKTTQRRLTLKIRDTGKGIPDHALPHIFDRFYQVDGSTTREGEGSGIGLSLTKEIVELMGGEIKVKSWEGTGTEFTIHLPIKVVRRALPVTRTEVRAASNELAAAPITLPLAAPVTRTEVPAATPQEDNGLPTLLLIEDNPDVVAYLATCLNGDYTLLVGKDGQEGIEIALDRIPDIIITDVMMPRKDGFEVSKILKNDQRTSHIPIIMLTAKADMESKLAGLEQGVEAYLSKPFNKEELLLRLRKLLEMRKRLQQHYQSVAGLAAAPVEVVENGELVEDATVEQQEDYFVLKVRRSVEDHLGDFDFNVEKLCKDVGMSHSQLHRKLSAVTGLSANKFIRSIRLNKAKELLQQQPPLSVTAVAMDCGFNDPGYFGRVFKKEFGKTPVEWQEINV